MDTIDTATELPEEPVVLASELKESPLPALDKLAAAAANYEVNNLFDMLDQAGQQHHDALVELKGNLSLQKAQFRILQGGACLFKTAAGKA
jgi:hypothetical protein